MYRAGRPAQGPLLRSSARPAVGLGLADQQGHPGGVEEGRRGGVHRHDRAVGTGGRPVGVPARHRGGVDLAAQVQDGAGVGSLQPDVPRGVGRRGAAGHGSSGIGARIGVCGLHSKPQTADAGCPEV